MRYGGDPLFNRKKQVIPKKYGFPLANGRNLHYNKLMIISATMPFFRRTQCGVNHE